MSSTLEASALQAQQATHRTSVGLTMLLMAVLGEMCLAADFYGFAAVISLVSQDLALTESQAGLVQGAFGVSFALGMLFWAPLGRKMTSKRLYLIGLAGSGALMIAQMYANSFGELILLRLVVGFFDAAVWIGSMKIVMQWFQPKRQGLIMGIILGAYSLAITLDFALGLPYAMANGWREFFFVLGVLTLSVGFVTQFVLRPGPFIDPHDIARGGVKVFSEVFQQRWIWIAICGIFGALFSIGATATWVIPSYIQTQNLDPSLAPTVGMIMGLSQVGFLLLGGYLSDKLSRFTMIRTAILLTIISALLCVASTIWPLSVNTLMLIATLCGVGVFGGGAIFALIGEKYGSDLGPAAAGYAEMFGVLGSFVAPAIMGAVLTASSSFAAAFWTFAIVESALLAALLVMMRHARSTPAPVAAQ